MHGIYSIFRQVFTVSLSTTLLWSLLVSEFLESASVTYLQDIGKSRHLKPVAMYDSALLIRGIRRQKRPTNSARGRLRHNATRKLNSMSERLGDGGSAYRRVVWAANQVCTLSARSPPFCCWIVIAEFGGESAYRKRSARI